MKLLIIQRLLSNAPNDGQFVSFNYKILGEKLPEVAIITHDAPSISYENFDAYISQKGVGLLTAIAKYDFDTIAIPATYGPTPLSYDGFRLAMHIRLSPELGEKRFVPIILMGFEEVIQLAQLGCAYLSFLATPQIYYAEESIEGLQFFIKNEFKSTQKVTDKELIDSLSQYPINPPPHLESNHSLANEWGALELDRATVNVLSDREQWLENSLYIKYLMARLGNDLRSNGNLKLSTVLQASKPFTIDSHRQPKVLYIDDEHDKGWGKTLEAIFKEAGISFDCVNDLKKGQSRQKTLAQIKDNIREDQWNLILLDVRLTEGDYQEEDFKKFSGFEVLEFIKGRKINNIWTDGVNTILPVIMFTASTKAKIFETFTENGADGFYIKHSPDTIRTQSTVKTDVNNFFILIKNSLHKHSLLSSYWNGIREIEDSNLLREKNVGRFNETCFRERIYERLRMFIGLLKKSYEETNFDQDAFFYDEHETAFLTLWSCLNEISECYFIKNQPVYDHLLDENGNQISNNNGQPITRNPNGRPLTYRNATTDKHYRWELNGALFLEYKYWAKYDTNNNLAVDSQCNWYFTDFERISAFELVNGNYIDSVTRKIDVDYQKEIRMQIAFILIKKFGTGNNESDPIIKLFEDCRRLRNHLYLVHGDDSNTDYTKTIRQGGVKVTASDIKNLFKLVYFLLKGTVPTI